MHTTTDCPFCNIAKHFPPSPAPKIDAYHHKISPPAYVLLSTPLCLAFLDILPLSSGHVLLITRQHREKITDVKEEESRELGVWLSKLSGALARVTDVWDWNIVQNNGAAAAQVVNHIHFHIIPRPALTPELRNKSFTMFGRGHRSNLVHHEAAELVKKLKLEIEKETNISNRERL
ncbi:putative hit domain-containing protein [Erysiphe necator]|uniref:Putative hit domain-containing protein n=1 Tax=Uncinula necator TaxID=52586 RepID=A0A0B1NXJ3_UNCNE|nr:putative hit domain-containing protein [Erysiphe necator]